MDCLFCEIVKGNIPSKKLYEDEQCVAFYDINPMAPVHFLVVPKAHIFCVIAKLAKEQGLCDGYRIVNNCKENAGQTVRHLHFHVLGGGPLSLQMA